MKDNSSYLISQLTSNLVNEIKDIAVRSTFMFDYDILFQKIVNYVKNAINNNSYYLDKNQISILINTLNLDKLELRRGSVFDEDIIKIIQSVKLFERYTLPILKNTENNIIKIHNDLLYKIENEIKPLIEFDKYETSIMSWYYYNKSANILQFLLYFIIGLSNPQFKNNNISLAIWLSEQIIAMKTMLKQDFNADIDTKDLLNFLKSL